MNPSTAVTGLPSLETERLRLRVASTEDIPAIIEYYRRNERHLRPWSPQWPDDFFTEQYRREALDNAIREFHSGRAVRFVLFDRLDPRLVLGGMNFSEIVRAAAQFCYLGFHLDEQSQGKGLMFEAVKAGISYMFEQSNLHRIMAGYIPHNQRSGNLLKRLGFTVYGYAQDYLHINGRWQDHVLTSLTNLNWKE